MLLSEIAKTYRDKFGFSIIPVRPMDEVATLLDSWEPFTHRHATDAEIEGWCERWPNLNIGAVCGAISGISVIQSDTVDAEDALFKVVPIPRTPTEITPRGGKHLFYKYHSAVKTTKSECIKNIDTKSDGGMVVIAPSRGPEGSYRWIPGFKPSEIVDWAPFPEEYLALIKANASGNQIVPVAAGGGLKMFEAGCREESLFHVANQLAKANTPVEEIVQMLTALIASWGEEDPKWVSEKVKSALDRTRDKRMDIPVAVKQWAIVQPHPFKIESIFRELNLKSTAQMAEVRAAVQGLTDQGIVETEKAGFFRLVDRKIKHIIPTETPCIPVRLPLGLNDIVQVHPHDVIVVSGWTGAGKTAIALDIAEKNMDSYFINYLASELTADDLAWKLKYMPKLAAEYSKPIDDATRRVRIIERLHAPWDLIIPDAINIVDYLEVHEDFFAVGGWLLKCFEKLTTGICIICLQKNKDAEYARGGAGTLQKASLVVNLDEKGDHKKATIKKARWRAQHAYNPVGRSMDYRLDHGVIPVQVSDFWWLA